MSEIIIGNGSTSLGGGLNKLMEYDAPGGELSYEMAKIIFTDHVLGEKIACGPIKLAMSQRREISVPNSPETMIKDAFEREWDALKVDDSIFQVSALKRIYGVSSLAIGAVDVPTDEPLDYKKMADYRLYFSCFDPLNTAGSMVLNQNPNAPDFLKCTVVTAAGQKYHFSRTVVVQNDIPVYLAYTPSSFGYNGRSSYQRALFSLKSYVTCQLSANFLAEKSGVLVIKRKAPGSITDKVVGKITGLMRSVFKFSKTNSVISITPDDSAESLNLTNADAALKAARDIVLEDVANAVNMPVKLFSDIYAAGLANGTEDFKATMQYINGIRQDMKPLYDFCDNIVQHRAWSPEFYARVQKCFPSEYGSVSYEAAFSSWKNCFTAIWPSMMLSTPEEDSKVDKVKLDSVIQLIEKLLPNLDPDNAASLIEFGADNISAMRSLFTDPLEIDSDTLIAFLQEKQQQAQQSAQNPIGDMGLQ